MTDKNVLHNELIKRIYKDELKNITKEEEKYALDNSPFYPNIVLATKKLNKLVIAESQNIRTSTMNTCIVFIPNNITKEQLKTFIKIYQNQIRYKNYYYSGLIEINNKFEKIETDDENLESILEIINKQGEMKNGRIR